MSIRTFLVLIGTMLVGLFVVNNLQIAFKNETIHFALQIRDIDTPKLSGSDENNIMLQISAASPYEILPKKFELDAYNPRPYEPDPRPPLEDIVAEYNFTGDPQWLINFAVAAFPKTGTSSLMHYFADNPEIQIFKAEQCELCTNQHAKLVKWHYNGMPAGDYVRGIKCPRLLELEIGMSNYEKLFPKTDMLVGLRHPVKWFESFYNHRVYNRFTMRPMEEMIGTCPTRCHGCFTDRANFHIALAKLGRTNLSKEELKWMPMWDKKDFWGYETTIHTNFTGRVFLYEVTQLSDRNPERAQTFRTDLQHFLHLRKPLPPMVWFKPGENKSSEDRQYFESEKVNICDKRYFAVRERLMEHAVQISNWIRTYFMEAPGVVISSPEYLEELLMTYLKDPCDESNTTAQATSATNCTKGGCFVATNDS